MDSSLFEKGFEPVAELAAAPVAWLRPAVKAKRYNCTDQKGKAYAQPCISNRGAAGQCSIMGSAYHSLQLRAHLRLAKNNHRQCFKMYGDAYRKCNTPVML